MQGGSHTQGALLFNGIVSLLASHSCTFSRDGHIYFMPYLEGLSFSEIAGPLPERRVLSNGLEVIYVSRPGIGLCTVQAWVRTGSVYEGKWEGSGISHYLEHMVFKGTGRFANRELTEAIHQAGGNSNAYTTFDRTVYYVDAPAEGFATAMEAISEMVFDPLITESDAAMEREVILREIAMRDDEHDSILAEKALAETLHNHPMRHPIIGHKDLFIRITPDDLRSYHASRYVPSNVVLAIGGSMDSEEVFATAEQWFGRFSRQSTAPLLVPSEPPQAGPRRVECVRDVSTTKGIATWRVPGFLSEKRNEFDLFLSVLGGGNSSRLWQELREKRQLCHAIDIHATGLHDLGLAWLSWIADAHADVPKIEKAVFEVVDDLLQKGINEAQLNKARRQTVVAMVNGLKGIHAASARFGYAACVAHDIHSPLRDVSEIAAATPEGITEIAREWISPMAVTLATLKGKKSNNEPVPRDRREMPETFEVVTLENGVRVLLQPDDALPKAGFGVFLGAGIAYEEKEKRGVTGLLSTLLARDTVMQTKEEIAELVDQMGATFRDCGSQLSCGLWGEALSSDFNRIAELVKNGVLYPKLSLETFKIEQSSAISACREAADDIVEKARLSLLKQFFGEHPLSIDVPGTPETLATIRVDDVVKLHQSLVVPENLVIGISGSFNRTEALQFVQEHFVKLPRTPFKVHQLIQHHPLKAQQVTMEAVGEQAVVCLAFPHCGFGPEIVTAANVTEELLSGMASGLFHRVRETKGLAYFVGASRLETIDQGMFYLYGGTTATAATEVVAEMKAELERFRRGKFGETEIEDAKRRLRVTRRQGRQSASNRMMSAMTREIVGLGANYDAEWERRMALTGPKAVQSFVEKYLNPQFAQELIVYPKKG